MRATIKDAIETSRYHSSIETINGDIETVLAIIGILEARWQTASDWQEVEPGVYDVWGWEDGAAEGEMDWRLRVQP